MLQNVKIQETTAYGLTNHWHKKMIKPSKIKVSYKIYEMCKPMHNKHLERFAEKFSRQIQSWLVSVSNRISNVFYFKQLWLKVAMGLKISKTKLYR